MSDTWQILVASSDLQSRRTLVSTLDRQGFDSFCASNVSQCREILDSQHIRLVFCERAFADGDYRDVLSAAAGGSQQPKARLVLLTALADSEQYRRAKEQGVFEVINAACRPTDVEWMVIQARRDEQQRGATLLASTPEAVRERSHSAGTV
jgi:DNA-binding NtrC family response regulator